MKTWRQIAESAVEAGFKKALKPYDARLSANKTTEQTTFAAKRWECAVEVQVTDDFVFYAIHPRRVGLEGIWFGNWYAFFSGLTESERSSFRNSMTADFKALFSSAYQTPYAWEEATWENDTVNCPFMLTDAFWVSRRQTAPVALRYPAQTWNSSKMRRIRCRQDGMLHSVWGKDDPALERVEFISLYLPDELVSQDTVLLLRDVTER